MNTVSIRCPHCGKTLEVPEDAGKIVCMFCAQPIDFPAEQKKSQQAAASEGDLFQYLKEAEEHLTDDVFSFQIRSGELSSKSYPLLFERYQAILHPFLQSFQYAAAQDETVAADKLSGLLLDGFLKRYRSEKHRAEVFDARFTLTSLAIPAILELKTPAAEKLADLLLQKWNAQDPKHPLGKANYEAISGGFRKKLCFITTAVCSSLHKGDSCEELTEFRRFRDGWLAATEQGPAKIQEYYLFAPMIVEAIDRSEKSGEEYRRIWQTYLEPCFRELRGGRNEACSQRYEGMMMELEQKWFGILQ